MKKLFLAAAVSLSITASTQTLFYYGKDSVSAADFVQAYRKNNPGAKNEVAFKEYLDLYIASRLKIKEAIEQGYDTLPQFVADLQNLRAQVMPQYMNDKAVVDGLVAEAFTRSQKDIHLAHIFIAFQQNGVYDTTAANRKRDEVAHALKSGKPFSELAKKYSDDPSAKNNGGDIGWITVFSLPYALENLAYSTPVGKFSPAFRSNAGYHFFKNMAERKALGKIKAAQILIAFPPDADAASKERARQLADSVYNRLQKGDDFGALASALSNDVISAASGGQIPEFGVGQFDPQFENAVYAIQNGIVSKPFQTAHGYHVIKRTARLSVSSTKDEKTLQDIRQKVEASDRIQWAKKSLAQKVLKEGNYKAFAFDTKRLWVYTDSAISRKPVDGITGLQPATPLFKLGKQDLTVQDWINYALVYRYKPNTSEAKPYHQVWDEFVEKTAIDYYQNNLEEFNEPFRRQINEFRDGNLFFEIMQKRIWEPAQTDDAALKNFYEKAASKYKWNKSATAVVFFSTDASTGNLFIKELNTAPANWNELLKSYSEKIVADSARFEIDQIPNAAKAELRKGMITSPVINSNDNSASFAYIIHIHDKPEQKSFADAKGQVVSDYQSFLEAEWLNELKKKYPVSINQKVLKDVLKSKAW